MTPFTFLLGLVVFWAIFLTVVFRLEKRMVWPYGELEPAAPFEDATGYGARSVAEAVAAGFTLLGWARDIKGPTYRVSYAMLISPDRDMFAIVGFGSLLKIPVEATWLYTPAMDGRSFYSTNKQSGVQIDLSRNCRNQLVLASNFTQLLRKHREWLLSLGVFSRAFTPGREYAEFRRVREDRFLSMERAGLIRFTDASISHFHFTLYGAAKTAIWGYLLGMVRHVSNGRFPRTA